MDDQPHSRSKAVEAYVATTAAAAGGGLWLAFALYGPPRIHEVALFWVLGCLALATAIELPRPSPDLTQPPSRPVAPPRSPSPVVLSPGFVVLLTAAFAIGPAGAMLVGLVPAVTRRRPSGGVAKLTFNASQEALYAGGAAVVFDSASALHDHAGVGLGAALLAALVAVAANISLVAGVICLERRARWADVAGRMVWTVPHSFGFALVAVMVAVLYKEFGLASTVFLAMPVLALRFVRQSKMELEAAGQEALMAFVRTVEAKDPFTYRHSERVAEICTLLHEEMGTKPRAIERRQVGALLHDVGKVTVPALILTKPGLLTDEEYEIVKRHPVLGAEVARRIDIFNDLVSEILYHHERMDGSGYPHGLKGTEIPFAARVLAVADAFEALTSDRHYRPAMGTREALAELERSAGSHLDPEGVSALRAVIERGFVFSRPERTNVVPLRPRIPLPPVSERSSQAP